MEALQIFGGRGGASGLKTKGISSADDAKNFNELSDYMQKAYSVNMDKNLEKYDFSTVKECATRIEVIMNDFPSAKGVLETIKTMKYQNGVLGQTSFINTEVTLSDKMLTGITMKQYYSNGWSPKSPYLEPHEAIMTHELGHVLEATLVKKKTSNLRKGVGLWNNHTEAKAIIEKAYKRAYGKSATSQKIKYAMLNISRYGTTTMGEAMAECITECYAARELAHPLSRAVYDVLKEELK